MRPTVTLPLLLTLVVSFYVNAAPTTHSVAQLVHVTDEKIAAESLAEGLRSPDRLVRATAARVAAVKGIAAIVPQLHERLASETDLVVAREAIRAIALLGGEDDRARAAEAALRWPPAMDNALALAVARRGGTEAINFYVSKLAGSRMTNRDEFFRVALWGHSNAVPLAGSRLLAARDQHGWRGLLGALRRSGIAAPAAVITSSLTSDSEDIRAASIWFLVRGYADDPAVLPVLVKESLATPRAELSSDREDFGRELLRRMAGGERKNDARWLRFLDSDEGDRLLAGERAVLDYLTDEEYARHQSRCSVQTRDCALPARRGTRTIPSQPVAPQPFELPTLLPAGLADAVLAGSRCSGAWLGVGRAKVDRAGRVETLDLESVQTDASCRRAIDTLLRLSFASPASLRSEFTGPVLLVRPRRGSLCLDEDETEQGSGTHRVGGEVQAPKIKKRVEPQFPATARSAMGSGANVLVIAEMLISKSGCVRSLRLLAQSPFPEVNGAALAALSQWTFSPAYLDGQPVDVLFNVTINFKVS